MSSSAFNPIRVFSNESVLRIQWPKYWSFNFSISPSNEYSGLISIRVDWLDLLAVQGTLKSLLQHHSSKASILWLSIRERFNVLPSLCAPRRASPVSTALRPGDSPAGVTPTPTFCWVLRQPRRPGTEGGRSGVHSSAPRAEPGLAAAASLSRGPALPGRPFGCKLSLESG